MKELFIISLLSAKTFVPPPWTALGTVFDFKVLSIPLQDAAARR
jgi:hypothetical protein